MPVVTYALNSYYVTKRKGIKPKHTPKEMKSENGDYWSLETRLKQILFLSRIAGGGDDDGDKKDD